MAKKRLFLTSLKGTRQSLARVTRELYAGDLRDSLEPAEIRMILDALKALVAAHKAEAELRVADEVAAIREALKAKGII